MTATTEELCSRPSNSGDCCLRGREPSSAAERLARGREIIEQMSAKLGAAQAFSVTTDEKREVIRAGGEPQPTALDLLRGSGS